MERIIRIELEGKTVLGFDTGLNAQTFAQAKLSHLITQTGLIVYPDGTTSIWKAEGVVEYGKAGQGQGTMVVWGPDFSGERLDRIIDAAVSCDAAISRDAAPDGAGPKAGNETALDALRYWLQAQIAWINMAQAGEDAPVPWPAGAIIALESSSAAPEAPAEAASNAAASGCYPPGTVFFPPGRLARRVVEAEAVSTEATLVAASEAAATPDAWLTGAERWTHPDLAGPEAVVFAAAAMFYRLLSGVPPYPSQDVDVVRSDIREEVLIPLRLMAPGIEDYPAGLILRSLSPIAAREKRPELEEMSRLLGKPASGGAERYFHPLSDEERAAIEAEQEQFNKAKSARVKTRRFIRRNTAILMGTAVIVLVVGLVTGSLIKGRLDLPNTRGMSPQEVVETYYSAFAPMDHTLMEACVINKAGKGDIDMVTNLFVISKVRQAYEMGISAIPAQEWLDSGAAPTEFTVFGVTGLRLDGEDTDEGDGEVRYRAAYTLWTPPSFGAETEPLEPSAPEPSALNADPGPVMPVGFQITDEVRLIWRKDAWRITEIQRKAR
jgi:hypothetical protein